MKTKYIGETFYFITDNGSCIALINSKDYDIMIDDYTKHDVHYVHIVNDGHSIFCIAYKPGMICKEWNLE